MNLKLLLQRPKIFTAVFLLAILGLGLVPASARAATIKVSDISIKTTDLGGENGVPLYRYAIQNKPDLTIKLKLNLVSPNQIQPGDKLDAPWFQSNPDIKGIFLGLKGDPNANCGSTYLDYVSCTYDFDNSDSGKGFRLIMPMAAGKDEGYTVTLTYDDLVKLGIPTNTADIPDNGKLKDVFFEPNVAFAGKLGLPGDSSNRISMVNGSFTVRIYVFKTEQQKQTATNLYTGGLPGSSPGSRTAELSGSNSILGGFLLSVVNILLGIIIGLLRYLGWILTTTIFLPLLKHFLSIDAATISTPIIVGWTYVRDVVNMFFILILIVIGFGTMLRLESYSYKKLLVNLILMALLVNFSMLIGRIILQLADTAQFNFLPASNGSDGVQFLFTHLGTVAPLSILDGFRTFTTQNVLNSTSAMMATFALIFQFILELGVMITFGALAIFLLIRTIAIWILLILSPFAYALTILPATAALAHKWWSTFIKYALFTPIVAFFLRLTLELFRNGLQIFPEYQSKWLGQGDLITKMNLLASQGGGATFDQTLALLMIYVVILAFLWAGMIVAKEMGIAGAGAIVGLAEKGMKLGGAAALFVPKRLGGRVARWYNEKTAALLEAHEGKKPGNWKKAAFAVLNPVAFARGWDTRAKELSNLAKETATARGHEVAEQFLTRGKLQIPYAQLTERAEENKYLQEYKNMRKEKLMESAVAAEGLGGFEGDVRRRAIVKAAAAQGYMDDLLRMKQFANKYSDKDGSFYGTAPLNRFLYGYLGHGEQAMRFMAEDMEDLGKETGHYEYLGHAYFDPDSKTMKRGMEVIGIDTFSRGGKERKLENLKNTWQQNYQAGEFEKVGGRVRAAVAPHNFLSLRADVDQNGNFIEQGEELRDSVSWGRADGSVDESQSAMLRRVGDEATLRDIHFAQSRQKDAILSADVDKNTGEIIVKDEAGFKKIENIWKQQPEFIKAMFGQHTGLQRNQITGLRVAWLQTDPQGHVSKVRHEIGDPSATVLPVKQIITQEVTDNPALKISELKDQDVKTVRASVDAEISNVYLGRMGVAQLERSIQDRLSAANITLPVGVTAAAISNDVFEKIKTNTEARYNPESVIKKIDFRLHNQGQTRLNVGQINSLSQVLSRAVGESYEQAAKNAISLDANPTILRNKIQQAIQGIQGLPQLTPQEIESFVQHAKPIS